MLFQLVLARKMSCGYYRLTTKPASLARHCSVLRNSHFMSGPQDPVGFQHITCHSSYYGHTDPCCLHRAEFSPPALICLSYPGEERSRWRGLQLHDVTEETSDLSLFLEVPILLPQQAGDSTLPSITQTHKGQRAPLCSAFPLFAPGSSAMYEDRD